MYLKKNEAIVFYSSEWNTYHAKENQSHLGYNRRCIDGRIVGNCKCVGYCNYMGHPGFLTEKLRKEHDCLNKGCDYYIARIKEPSIINDILLLTTPVKANSICTGSKSQTHAC